VKVLTIMFVSMIWLLLFSSENTHGVMQKENGKISEAAESSQVASRPLDYAGNFMGWWISP